MRNADEIARKIAKAVMDRIDADRGIHLSSIEDEVRKNLLLQLEVPAANAQIAAFPLSASGVPVIEHTVANIDRSGRSAPRPSAMPMITMTSEGRDDLGVVAMVLDKLPIEAGAESGEIRDSTLWLRWDREYGQVTLHRDVPLDISGNRLASDKSGTPGDLPQTEG